MSTIYELAKETKDLLYSTEITAAEYTKATELVDKLEDQTITVSVIGQFKRGKSTLVNTVLCEELLPVGLIPITSAVTIIKYGEKNVTVHFLNGVNKSIKFEELSEYISEEKNPNNCFGVSHVTIKTPSPFLKEGLSFVDTPGVGSMHTHNSAAAYSFVKESDAVIFMLSVDSPINEIEVEFLKNAKEYAGKFYFAVNKIDGISEFELNSYLSYCESNIKKLMNIDKVKLYPMSAKENIGLDELKDKIVLDLKSEVSSILDESVKMKLIYTIKSALTQLDLYWNALTMPSGRLENRLKLMKESLEKANEESKEITIETKKDTDNFLLKLSESIDKQKDLLEKAKEKNKANRFENTLNDILEDAIDDISTYMNKVTKHYDTKFNEIKIELSKDVSENFGMDYHFDLDEVNYDKNCSHDLLETNANVSSEYSNSFDIQGGLDNIKSMASSLLLDSLSDSSSKFNQNVRLLTENLNNTMTKILLYKEDNAMTVWFYINDINKTTRHLRRNRDILLRK